MVRFFGTVFPCFWNSTRLKAVSCQAPASIKVSFFGGFEGVDLNPSSQDVLVDHCVTVAQVVVASIHEAQAVPVWLGCTVGKLTTPAERSSVGRLHRVNAWAVLRAGRFQERRRRACSGARCALRTAQRECGGVAR